MSKTTSNSRMVEFPVAGTQFKFNKNQEVYICKDNVDELYTGVVIVAGSIPGGSQNKYRVKLESGVYSLYNEGDLIGRKYALFNKQRKQVNKDVFFNLKDAIDAEEDCGYDELSAQYHAANGEPNELVAQAIEVWEINDIGEPINKVEID